MPATRRAEQSASAQAPWVASMAATRTEETRRPAKMFKEGEASFRIWKHPHELSVGTGVVVPSHKRSCNLGILPGFAHHNILGQVALTDHPPKQKKSRSGFSELGRRQVGRNLFY